MLNKLGGIDSSHYFKFKIGDSVRDRLSGTTGTIVDGDCFSDLGMIFYVIKIPSGKSYTYMEKDLELL